MHWCIERQMVKGMVVERALDERVRRSNLAGQEAVNPVMWAREQMKAESCQEPADTKAFKGRGKAHALRQYLAEIDSLEQEMRELCDLTKQVQGAGLYLMLHRINRTGAAFLRWRAVGGSKKHLSWDEAKAMTLGFTAEVRDWYSSVTIKADHLNARHIEVRTSIKATRKAISRSSPYLYARPIPEGVGA